MSDPKSTTTPSEPLEVLLARAARYKLLARLFGDPLQLGHPSAELAEAARAGSELLGDERAAALIERMGSRLPHSREDSQAQYTRVFGLVVSHECPPYEVEYEKRSDVFWRSQRLADVSGFYRAFGLELDVRERPDHIAVEADFAWYLLERLAAAHDRAHGAEKVALLHDAFVAFFREHLGRWAPSFAATVRSAAARHGAALYELAADLLDEVCALERERLSIEAPPRLHPSPDAAADPAVCNGCMNAPGLGGRGSGVADGTASLVATATNEGEGLRR